MSDDFRLGAVIITMGNRPAELNALIESVRAQQGPPVELAVVGNGAPLPVLPEGVRSVELPENLGIPGGRNVGIELFGPDGRDVDAVLFLDDDGLLPNTDSAELLRAAFTADPGLGIVSFRIADPETGTTQRRHVPRLRASDPLHASRVTTFLGGASAVRSAVFPQAGQLPAEFFYAHEETDLAWRALDAGWSIDYRPDVVLHHPATSPARHATYFHNVARNRVWLARRNLPAPLVPLYLGTWFLLTVLRRPSGAALKAWLGGFRAGWSEPCGPRRPMKWSTVWRLTRLGRPPII
ncbi:glycosyltransferase family 2 protein [Kitasatospora cineracea]|uniref:GT2 family glycosyltransferase n=1 Tax=Kitasatospora cineracea TaxID=88074 RepID=A0A3N4SA88_9ACTN|nr:glycosyltransferase [Kitasatospora cineracea]ROR45197.1 GT2 family glycosyltransferase [Kitasatospora cineracea]RPE35550.1 GT2 family glycosyltransferase [Kitasatospora cineracea]